MPLPHLLLALLVVLIWGVNFLLFPLVLKKFHLCCSVPCAFIIKCPSYIFVKLPGSSFKIIALYGFIMFALQFSFLFIGMNAGMPAGMASLLMQTQVFFSMFLQ